MERVPPKKLIVLLFILAILSFFRLFRITINTSSTIQLPSSPALTDTCLPTDPAAADNTQPLPNTAISHADDSLTPKEYHLLSSLVSRRIPCNLLFFGLKPQFISLSKLNTKGSTLFLQDDAEKLRWAVPNLEAVKIHMVNFPEKASEAYKLLKNAREHPACRDAAGPLLESHCKLALTNLPPEIYQKNWDMIVVDGPSGDQLEAPGRMGVIYTAAMIARSGNATDVLVHDVDRIIEKWYSWEFLCNENMVSSKGKFWHFRIKGNSRSSRFCSDSD